MISLPPLVYKSSYMHGLGDTSPLHYNLILHSFTSASVHTYFRNYHGQVYPRESLWGTWGHVDVLASLGRGRMQFSHLCLTIPRDCRCSEWVSEAVKCGEGLTREKKLSGRVAIYLFVRPSFIGIGHASRVILL